MATTEKCHHCGGSDLAAGTLQSGNVDARVVIAGHPDGFLDVIPYTKSPIRAVVCRSCGYTMLFATQLTDLLAIEPEAPKNVGF